MDGKKNAEEIQKVINTLEALDISPTYANMNRLLGCMQVLARIRDELEQPCEEGREDNA
jgi:hypothetical protein